MTTGAGRRSSEGDPKEDRYDAGVKVERVSVETVRKEVGVWVKQAADAPLDSHKLVGRHSVESLVVVDLDWYRRARKALKDPTDL